MARKPLLAVALATSLLAGGAYAQAGPHTALPVRPSANPEAMAAYTRGATAFNAHDYPGASAAFRQATELDPEFSTAWRELGLSAIYLRQDDAAVAALRHAVQLDPADGASHALFGTALAGSGDFRAAVPELEAAIRYDPGAVDNYWLMALTELKLNDLPAAAWAEEQAVRLSAADPQKLELLGRIYLDLGLTQSATAVVARLRPLDSARADHLAAQIGSASASHPTP